MMMNNVEIKNALTLNTTMYQLGISRTITSANRDPHIVQSWWYCFSISKAGRGKAYTLEDVQVCLASPKETTVLQKAVFKLQSKFCSKF